jgi:hypothetical protein
MPESNGYGKLPQAPYLLDRKLVGELVIVLDTVVDRWRRSPAEGQREMGERVEELLLRLECACTVSDSLGRRWGAAAIPTAPAPPAPGPVTEAEEEPPR